MDVRLWDAANTLPGGKVCVSKFVFKSFYPMVYSNVPADVSWAWSFDDANGVDGVTFRSCNTDANAVNQYQHSSVPIDHSGSSAISLTCAVATQPNAVWKTNSKLSFTIKPKDPALAHCEFKKDIPIDLARHCCNPEIPNVDPLSYVETGCSTGGAANKVFVCPNSTTTGKPYLAINECCAENRSASFSGNITYPNGYGSAASFTADGAGKVTANIYFCIDPNIQNSTSWMQNLRDNLAAAETILSAQMGRTVEIPRDFHYPPDCSISSTSNMSGTKAFVRVLLNYTTPGLTTSSGTCTRSNSQMWCLNTPSGVSDYTPRFAGVVAHEVAHTLIDPDDYAVGTSGSNNENWGTYDMCWDGPSWHGNHGTATAYGNLMETNWYRNYVGLPHSRRFNWGWAIYGKNPCRRPDGTISSLCDGLKKVGGTSDSVWFPR